MIEPYFLRQTKLNERQRNMETSEMWMNRSSSQRQDRTRHQNETKCKKSTQCQEKSFINSFKVLDFWSRSLSLRLVCVFFFVSVSKLLRVIHRFSWTMVEQTEQTDIKSQDQRKKKMTKISSPLELRILCFICFHLRALAHPVSFTRSHFVNCPNNEIKKQ